MSKLSENLRILRMLRGKSIRQIAQLTDRSPSTISNWERGKISPDADAIEKLCEILNVSPNQLLGWEESKEIQSFLIKQEQAYIELNHLQQQKAEIENKIKKYTEMISRNLK